MNTTNPIKQAQCPHCKSIFSVSEEEIQLALGAVRCGECMKIFNASYHLIEKQHPIATSAAEKELALMISTAKLAKAKAGHRVQSSSIQPSQIPETQPPIGTIPTLQEPILEEELEVEEPEEALETKKISPPFIAGLFLLLITLSVGGWLFINQTPAATYAFTDVRLTPSSINTKKMDVYFKISNISQKDLPLPNLTIQLLNLSSQPVSSETVMAADLKPNLHQLAAAATHEIQASVERPAIFVQGAHIQVHLNNSKL